MSGVRGRVRESVGVRGWKIRKSYRLTCNQVIQYRLVSYELPTQMRKLKIGGLCFGWIKVGVGIRFGVGVGFNVNENYCNVEHLQYVIILKKANGQNVTK